MDGQRLAVSLPFVVSKWMVFVSGVSETKNFNIISFKLTVFYNISAFTISIFWKGEISILS